MWGFPLVELPEPPRERDRGEGGDSARHEDIDPHLDAFFAERLPALAEAPRRSLGSATHRLTHLDMTFHIRHVRCESELAGTQPDEPREDVSWQWVAPEDFAEMGVPTAMRKIEERWRSDDGLER
jgi:adenine-specific DNA glycosylase